MARDSTFYVNRGEAFVLPSQDGGDEGIWDRDVLPGWGDEGGRIFVVMIQRGGKYLGNREHMRNRGR